MKHSKLAAGTPRILLPWDNAQVFRKNLEARNLGQYASWTVWSVPSTMTVANAATRLGIDESDLRKINGIPPRMMIKAGSALMVPRAAGSGKDVPGSVADNGQMAFTPEIIVRRSTVRAGKHDTVATIARRYKVTASDVADWNDLKTSSRFKPGESIVLYLATRNTPAAHSASPGKRPASAHKTASTVKRAGQAKPAAPAHKKAVPAKKRASR